MAYRIVFQTRALRDIDGTFAYLHDIAPSVAARWYRSMRSQIRTLTSLPNRCPLAPEAQQVGIEVRQMLHNDGAGKCRILYRIGEEQNEVRILAVRHSARRPLTNEDVTHLLSDD